MQPEILILALGAFVAFVHVGLAGHYKTQQYGITWNTGARDEELPPLNAIPGRLARAQANFYETLPLAIVGLFGVVLAGKANELTATCGWIWLVGRVVYIPLYWSGVPKVRTLVWMIATLPLLVVLGVLVFG